MTKIDNRISEFDGYVGTIEKNLVVIIPFDTKEDAKNATLLLNGDEKNRTRDQALIQIIIMRDIFKRQEEQK